MTLTQRRLVLVLSVMLGLGASLANPKSAWADPLTGRFLLAQQVVDGLPPPPGLPPSQYSPPAAVNQPTAPT
ncbi:MAG TPA: hypothetical protein V6C88_10520, partial [Chroococcidiopsis sp.]